MQDDQRTHGPTLDRRRMLQVLGAGTALAGLGTGTAAADDHCYPEELVSGDDVHPVFGVSALEADIEPPVEPSHEIEAMIRPVEGREIPEFLRADGAVRRAERRRPVHPRDAALHRHRLPPDVRADPARSRRRSTVLLAGSGGGAYWLYTFEAGASTTSTAAPTSRSATPGGSSRGPRRVRGPNRSRNPRTKAKAVRRGGRSRRRERGRGGAGAPPAGVHRATVLGDPALDPERIVDRGRVSWDEIADESKELPV